MYSLGKRFVAGSIVMLVAVALLITASVQARASNWSWTTEKIDSEGSYPSLQIDSNGNLHLVYVAHYKLFYAFRSEAGKRWFAMPVDVGKNATGIALDSKQRPRVCYELSDGQLRYASFDGKAWQPQPIGIGSGLIMFSCAVAVGRGDTPHVFWYQVNRGGIDYYHLRHASLSNGAWRASTVDMAGETGKWHSATSSPDGVIHVAYSAFPDAQLKYARLVDNHWTIEVVDARPPKMNDNSHPIFGASIVLDKSGAPAISYSSETELRVARRLNDKWTVEKVDTILTNRENWWEMKTSAAFDEQGSLHIVYQDAGALKHAYQDEGKWTVETVIGTQGDTSRFGVMTAAKNGLLHIVYRDPDNGALMMATGHSSAGQRATSVVGAEPGSQEKGSVTLPSNKPAAIPDVPAAKK